MNKPTVRTVSRVHTAMRVYFVAETDAYIAHLIERAEVAERERDNWKQETKIRNSQLELAVKQRKEQKERAEAAEEKLAEMQKQKPAGKFAFEPVGGRWHHVKHGEAQDTEPKLPLVKLFTRPAPAINLAELVPEGKLSLNNGIVGWDEGWNACIAEIMCNIEELKNV